MAVTELLEEKMRTAAAETAVRSGARVDQRISAGKALRQKVPRGSHAISSSPVDRPDPLNLLQAQDQTRMSELVPIRYGRMLASPFAFMRGSAAVMAHDLAATPTTQLIVQACGDAHLSNFGVFATPERNLVFGVNDFDQTLPAPWEWDAKRLAASVIMDSSRLALYAGLCGWALARAHARSGDPAQIAGYLGTTDRFDNAIVDFATTYADQTERDHAALVQAVKNGRIRAEQR